MPHNTRFFTTGGNVTAQRQVFTGRGHNRGCDGFAHRVELMIGGYFLDESFAVILEQNKETDIVEQKFPVKKALNDGF